MPFVPPTAFVLSRISATWSSRLKTLTVVLCLSARLICSLWTRDNLTHSEANWKAAQIASSGGADPNEIAGNMTRSCYHGAFDHWLAQTGGPPGVPVYKGRDRLHPPFLISCYSGTSPRIMLLVQIALRAESQVLAVLQYRDGWLRSHPVYVSKKLDSALYPQSEAVVFALFWPCGPKLAVLRRTHQEPTSSTGL